MGSDEKSGRVRGQARALKKGTLAKRIEKTSVRGKSYVLDLRIHSPHSLMGYSNLPGVEAAPALVRLAVVKGLDVIAVTDRNSGAFIDPLLDAAGDTKLTVLPGAEIRCSVYDCDDVVLSCFFPESYCTGDVEAFLRKLGIPQSAAGDKSFVVPKSFDTVLALLDAERGIALPSRVDKTPTRLAALPYLVEEYGFRAFDLAYGDSTKHFTVNWPKLRFSLFSFSNANALAQIGSRIAKVKMVSPGYEGVRDLVKREIDESQPQAPASA